MNARLGHFRFLFAIVCVLLMAACESPHMQEARRKQAVINAAQGKYFTDPDIGRRIMQRAVLLYPDIHAISENARAAGRKLTLQRLIKTVPPVYPISARMKGTTGGVWIAFVIGADGVPQRLEWLQDDGAINAPNFAEAAITAVSQWRFEPAKADGEPIPVLTVVPVIFQFPF